MPYNLLTDPVIRTVGRNGATVALSLPDVFAAMVADEVVSFPALRAHQRHGWHTFLAQLGTIVLHNCQVNDIPTEANTWRDLIRTVAGEYGDDPWTLVVADWSRPAFLQCPDPRCGKDHKGVVQTPDGLDVLVTSKNHDEKQDQAFKAVPDDWIFALLTLQTMAGFLGRGCYGIARMNGGQSSRWCFGLSPVNVGPGGHLVSDLRYMLSTREDTVSRHREYFASSGGTALVWLTPWDGAKSMPLRQLDPYFIEICRRVRLQAGSGRIWAKKAPSKKARVAAKMAKGAIGDFWTPIKFKDGAALTASRRTLQYDQLAEILFNPNKYKLPLGITKPASSKDQMKVVVRGWVGGQGKTQGYFERDDLRFSKKIMFAFGRRKDRDRLAELVHEQLNEVESVAKALRYAVAVMANCGRNEGLKANHWNCAKKWSGQFDKLVDGIFFRYLDSRYEHNAGYYRERFGRTLISFAREVFGRALGAMAWPSSARHRSLAVGKMTLERGLRNSDFGDLLGGENKQQATVEVAKA